MKRYITTICGMAGLLAASILTAQTAGRVYEQTPRDTASVTGVNKSGLMPTPSSAGFIFYNGRVYIITGNRAVLLTQEMSFRVTPTGFVGFNGQALSIPNGSMLSMDGQLMAAPVGLVDVTGNTLVLPVFNSQAAGFNSGITPMINGGNNAQQGFNNNAGFQGQNANPKNQNGNTNGNQNGNVNTNTTQPNGPVNGTGTNPTPNTRPAGDPTTGTSPGTATGGSPNTKPATGGTAGAK